MSWTTTRIPDLTGRAIVITGANSGIGLAAAEELAAHGADLTLAVRDPDRGAQAARVVERRAGGRVEVARLDLADLASVRQFADEWSAAHPDGLDVLVNNAGVMAIPHRQTADGFEMQLGTNHLGHFALTGLLLGAVRDSGRVVTVSSAVHRMGSIDFDDLQGSARYSKWGAYAQSKLANVLFALELHRRADAAGVDLRSIAVHPGYANTNLQRVGPRMSGDRIGTAVIGAFTRVLGQSATAGAWPTVRAATDPELPGGVYVGPTGWGGWRGRPGLQTPSDAARDPEVARRLWDVSTELTGVEYPW